jgi:tagatose 6-phosphate kinase
VIVTVTANAAIDRTLYVSELVRGSRHPVLVDRAQAGGKGVNVARVLRALGEPCHALVVVGGEAGRWIVRDLERSQVPAGPVWASGESRTCLEILEQGVARATRFHGLGVQADGSTLRALMSATERLLEKARWLALCGRPAAGLPEDAYVRLIELAQQRGVRVALDTSTPALRPAWAMGPALLRVNREEAAEALDLEPSRVEAPPANEPGAAQLGIVSDGPGRSLAWSADGGRWAIDPPAVEAVNPIGCGDAMLAGLIAALEAGNDVERALLRATALAAAEAESPVAGRPDLQRASQFEPQVRLIPLGR